MDKNSILRGRLKGTDVKKRESNTISKEIIYTYPLVEYSFNNSKSW